MENILIYIGKVNLLLAVFFLSYYFLLRKETFFQANRWFLLLGIVSSFVMPLLLFKQVVWIEPTSYEDLTLTNFTSNSMPFQENSSFSFLNWRFLLIATYFLVCSFLLIKLLTEFGSFYKVVKNGKKNKLNNIKIIESNQIQAPFSFFNYLIYNKDTFTEEEQNFILVHEQVHINEKHSIDVLIAKILCLLFWFNPIVWLYRKVILQNLEYIADYKTTKITNQPYEYQKTLLKVILNNKNQLSITNQFYQSLIKKRIVMLHKNPSQQKCAWKYSVVLPVLALFFLCFQVKTIAQVKKGKQEKTIKESEKVEFVIHKNTTDQEIKEETKNLKEEHAVNLKVSKVKRNKNEEITGIKIEYKDKEGSSGVSEIKGNQPIEPIVFFKETKNGKTAFRIGNKSSKNHNIVFNNSAHSNEYPEIILNGDVVTMEELEHMNTDIIKNVDVVKSDGKNKIIIKSFSNNSEDEDENEVLIFNDIDMELSADKLELEDIDPKSIKSVDVIKNGKKNSIKIVKKKTAGLPEDLEIYINGKKSSKEDLEKLQNDEIEFINIQKDHSKKIMEIQRKVLKEVDENLSKMNIAFLKDENTLSEEKRRKFKEEIERSKIEIEKARAEIVRAKAELEKAKAELEKVKEENKKNKR